MTSNKKTHFASAIAVLFACTLASQASAARKAYDGDGQNSEGERRESPALARQFSDYNALIADETFTLWCDALYRPLHAAPWRSLTGEESH